MNHSSHSDPVPAITWTAYGIRDAVIFAIGFAVAILPILPLG